MSERPLQPEPSSSGRRPTPSRVPRLWIALGVGLLPAAYAASGFCFVQPDERGVIRIFGRMTAADAGPGLHYAPPWPFGRVDRPKTTQVRRVTVGLDAKQRDLIGAGDVAAIAGSPRTDVLTGDTNILKVTLIVQYQVADPGHFILRTVQPEELVRRTAEAAMVETLARLPVDEVLTTAKVQLRDAVLARVRPLLRDYGTGIELVSASVQTIEPPAAVIASFKDVTSASYDRARLVERARNAGETLMRDAAGYAAERTNAGRVYAQNKLSRARGEAAAFSQRLEEYAKAPDVTRSRLFLTSMGRVLPRVRKLIVDEAEGRSPVQVRIVEPGAAPPQS